MWNKKINMPVLKNGYMLNMWQKKHKNLETMRIDSTMKNVDPRKLLDYKFKPQVFLKENKFVKESFEIETINDETKQYYLKISVPMIADRDDVVQIMIKDLSNDSWYAGLQSVQNDKYPPKDGVLRVQQRFNAYIRRNKFQENCWDYTEIGQFDYKVNFPPQVMNIFFSGCFTQQFKGMHKYAKIKGNKFDSISIESIDSKFTENNKKGSFSSIFNQIGSNEGKT